MVEEERLPTQNDLHTIILERYTEVYDASLVLRSTIEAAEGNVLAGKPDLKVSPSFLFCIFGKPEIAAKFPSAALATLMALEKAVEIQEPTSDLETIFFIGEQDNKLMATRSEQKPATADLPLPHIETVKETGRQTIAMVHTHPPVDKVLKPSTYHTTGDGREVGDLAAFARMREIRKESIAKGELPDFVEKPLSIILQSDMETETERMLFIMESDRLTSFSKEEYIEHLRQNKHLVEDAESDQEVVNALRQMGYKASAISLSTDYLYEAYSILNLKLPQIIQDLELS